MKVKELIKALQMCDENADVYHLWDGELRTEIKHVYMGKDGKCVTADDGMVAYSDEARPIDAPTSKEKRYWETPQENCDADDEI